MDLMQRDEELRWFGAALRRALAGAGALVTVEGAAGTGRSSFVQEARGRARDAGALVLATRATSSDQDEQHAVIRRLCAPVSHHETLGAERPDGVPAAFVDLVAALAADHPVLVAVDDADRCDRESLAALAELALRLDEVGGVVLLLARRHESPHCADPARLDAIYGDAAAVRIRLRALDLDGVAQMTDSALAAHGPATPVFARAVWDVTGGNPFLVHELLLTLGEDRATPGDHAAARVPTIGLRSVADRVVERVGGGSTYDVLTALAVLGDDATIATAAALSGVPFAETADLLGDLAAADLIHRADDPRFTHPLVRTSIRASIPPRRRFDLHAAAARALAATVACPDVVVRHLLSSAPYGHDWVVHSLRDAAARTGGFVPAAVPYLERALAEGVATMEPELRRDLAFVLAAVDDPRARDALRRAHALAPTEPERGEAALALARHLLAEGEKETAARVIDRAAPEVPRAEATTRTRLEAEWAYLTGPGATLPPAGRGAGAAGRLTLAHHAGVAVRRGEHPDEVARLAREALRGDLLFEEMGSLVPFLAVEALAAVDQLDEADAIWASALERADRCGLRRMATAVRAYRARVQLRLGRVDDALATARAALENVSAGAGPVRRRAVAALVESLLEAGEIDEAVAHIDRLRAVGTLRASLGVLVSARARLAFGQPAEALQEIEAAAAGLAGVSPAVAPWRSLAAQCEAALGNPERAWRLASDELEHARASRVPTAQARALRVLGSLDHQREGERLLAASPARLDHAHSLVGLGGALRTARHRTEARAVLKNGMEAAHRCGASALAAHARDELVAAGGRPRRPVHSGVDGLTRSERRVAELAAVGHTNREIGEQLYVTMNTVAAHLASVYRKLGISSRAQLPATLSI